jgi:hypothetical protein
MEPVRVWRVELRRGDIADREGTLSIEEDALVFADRSTGERRGLPFRTIRSAKRVKASPILLVVHAEGTQRLETAFYFSQPPPLDAPAPGSTGTNAMGRPLGPFAAMRRSSKRRHQRENVKYLATEAGRLKDTIQRWAEEIGARANG